MTLALVDGAAGFLGRHVAEALRARGIEVRASDHPRAAGESMIARDLVIDSLEDLVADVDVIVHVAGIFDLGRPEGELYDANVIGSRRLAEAAARAKTPRFVHVSSVTVYGAPRSTPAGEDSLLRPRNPYERSKLAGERAVREELPRAIVARPSSIYGPHGRAGVAPLMALYALAKARGGKGHRSIRGGPKMTHVHVEDVAEACALFATLDGIEGKDFNVADNDPIALGDLSAHLEREMGLGETDPIALTPIKARAIALGARALFWRTASTNEKLAAAWREHCRAKKLEPILVPRIDPHAYDYWTADHVYDTRALRRLGWRPKHPEVRRGMSETLQWYRENRWLD